MKKTMFVSLALAAVVGAGGCRMCCPCGDADQAYGQKQPRLLFDLSGRYTNPDGMTVRDGVIYLAMNNLASGKSARIMRVTADDRLEDVVELPAHPETGVVSPLGIGFGADGNLYVSDNQSFAGKGLGKSRLLRVVFDGARAVRVETVAQGLNEANGLAVRGRAVYVCDTSFGTTAPHTSGVYRFTLDELSADKPVQVKAGKGDAHCILDFTTTGEWPVGANGLAFDDAGHLYVCNFGDAVLWKATLDAADRVTSFAPFCDAKPVGVRSLDGAQFDGRGNIWIADFIGNAIVRIPTRGGRAEIVARNAPGDGADGALDAPSECIRRGDKIYVSNIDLSFGPNTADARQTMSVISLK